MPPESDDHQRPKPFTIILSVITVLLVAYLLGVLF